MLLHFLTIFLSHDLRTRQREKSTGQQNISLKKKTSILSINYSIPRLAIFVSKQKVRASESYLMGSVSAAASSIKNPLTFHPGSTLRARSCRAFIHLDTSGFAKLRVITHATGRACCLESNTRSVHKGYCNSTNNDINILPTNIFKARINDDQ
jgi:hypothetical protein